MASLYCRDCDLSWPTDPDDYIGFKTRRNFRKACAACLGKVTALPFRPPMSHDAAAKVAGWAEFTRREQKREKKRIKDGKPSPEELGRKDAEAEFEAQKALREQLKAIKELEEEEPGMIWHKRHRKPA